MPNYDLCRDSLAGLSVGDALGAQFFVPGTSFAELVAGGDVDTTAAIVGGIVDTFSGHRFHGIPKEWLEAREPLPDFAATTH